MFSPSETKGGDNLYFFNSDCAPSCDRASCFAYDNGKCSVLSDNSFKRECPFYKSVEEKMADDARCRVRAERWKKEREEKIKLALKKYLP